MKESQNSQQEQNQDCKESLLVGRPRIYGSKKKMIDAIHDYFNNGVRSRNIIIHKNGDCITVPMPTITGLCLHLGFESRQSFYDYEKDQRFSYIMKRAKLFIEREYEELLQHGNVTGAIFALKQFGWKDTVENTVVGDPKKPLKWTVELVEAGTGLIDRQRK